MISVTFLSGPFGGTHFRLMSFTEHMIPLAPSARKEQPALEVKMGRVYVGVPLCWNGRVFPVPMHSCKGHHAQPR